MTVYRDLDPSEYLDEPSFPICCSRCDGEKSFYADSMELAEEAAANEGWALMVRGMTLCPECVTCPACGKDIEGHELDDNLNPVRCTPACENCGLSVERDSDEDLPEWIHTGTWAYLCADGIYRAARVNGTTLVPVYGADTLPTMSALLDLVFGPTGAPSGAEPGTRLALVTTEP